MQFGESIHQRDARRVAGETALCCFAILMAKQNAAQICGSSAPIASQPSPPSPAPPPVEPRPDPPIPTPPSPTPDPVPPIEPFPEPAKISRGGHRKLFRFYVTSGNGRIRIGAPDSGAVGPSHVFLLPNDFEELRSELVPLLKKHKRPRL
jgi:hypothetical protein